MRRPTVKKAGRTRTIAYDVAEQLWTPEEMAAYLDAWLAEAPDESGVAKVVARKLDMLDYAKDLGDLASPPGNRLEALKGDLAGCHSIRVNDQWRVVFRWTSTGPTKVDIRDHH